MGPGDSANDGGCTFGEDGDYETVSQPRDDRNTVIYQMRQAGKKYSQIARQFDITRQRAHQIVEAVGDKLFLAGASA
jgi:hypothetical protein